MALVLGPFIPGSFWIMRLTYGRFGLYMLLNLITDWLFLPVSDYDKEAEDVSIWND
ncbi:hypothetical protein P5663_16240 [Priestia flexa]|uniref:hypothetical protein n=1 Tax=Priestia flexa TaxID=86664 RepID=UPI001F4490E5|nr:hypothetical protein [Priestia flexa]WEZ07568.1 hypothetical protein P5663_16240 [Priestia flexa]